MNYVCICALLIGGLALSCNNFLDKELILIPPNYIGPVYIVYEQKDGVEKSYSEDGSIIYDVPECGVLKCNFEANEGITFDMSNTMKVFYKSSKGEIGKEIKLYFDRVNSHNLDSSDIVVLITVMGSRTIIFEEKALTYPYLGITIDTLKNYGTVYEGALEEKLKECNGK